MSGLVKLMILLTRRDERIICCIVRIEHSVQIYVQRFCGRICIEHLIFDSLTCLFSGCRTGVCLATDTVDR